MSKDHKPDDFNEKLRIELRGGRIGKYKENGREVGPYRVWLKNQDIPGLAMSRSIGDMVAESVGVVPDPDIVIHQITSKDKFLILASDGVWEFIDNLTCIKIVSEFYEKNDIDQACEALMHHARKMWKNYENMADDITFVIAFFKS